ncbi:hypothetical protein LWF01_01145 [Saxibacter everestensis]|uniref:Uncharacterized protein n=1 Tax=Saxibacter everestensis TaxID=2909229 RepID=A0ABY8QTT6_9MICO|nr:hypothetical protein LWF01_01145 [Brevibacteriaceae bacterium ZFBP1038]
MRDILDQTLPWYEPGHALALALPLTTKARSSARQSSSGREAGTPIVIADRRPFGSVPR